MNLDDRQKQFLKAAQQHFKATKTTHTAKLFGVSNSSKVVGGGVQIGVANLNSARNTSEAFIIATVMKFPPEDEVYFAVLIRKDKDKLLARLAEMKTLGAAQKGGASSEQDAEGNEDSEEGEDADSDDLSKPFKYSRRNNLVPFYLGTDGLLWMRNSGFWNSLDFDRTPFGPGLEPDEFVVALYPPTASARRSLLAREFIGWIGTLAGRSKIHELQVWQDASAVSPHMQRLPPSIRVADIEAAVNSLGGYYPAGEVQQLHAALNFLPHKHFVILSGLSGTGKTRLASQYARAVHGLDDKASDPFLFVCPVRPEWTDPTGLTGYFDVLSNQYIVPPFLEAVLVATAHPATPVFVVLDELNIARVEYYLSDVLSCLESREDLQLHSQGVPLEGSTGTSIRAALPLPENLFIIGTINVDETTNPISDKVLDRAMLIHMSDVNLEGFINERLAIDPGLSGSCAACREALLKVQALMAPHGLGFGYRIAEEVVRYHAFVATAIPAQAATAMDTLLVQKVLVKLRGTERHRKLLTDLLGIAEDMPKAKAFLGRLLADLDEFGSFQASR